VSAEYIAIPSARGDSLGAITYWTLESGHNIDREEFLDALATVGLDPKHGPIEPSTQVLLARACKRAAGTRYIVRSKGSLVHVLCDESVKDDDRLLMGSAATFCLETDANGGTSVKVLRDTIGLSSRIVGAYVEARSVFSPEDVSLWLTDSVERRHAVRLRGAGGVYFVPQPRQEEWSLLAKVVAVTSEHRVQCVPALRVAEAADAVLDALTRECEAMMDAMVKFVAEQDPEKSRTRATKTKLGQIDDLRGKLAVYAGALDCNLDAMQSRLKKMRATVEEQSDLITATEVVAMVGGVA